MALGGAWFGEFRINLTPSEPIGLWRIEPLDRPAAIGDLVFICPPVGAITEFGMASTCGLAIAALKKQGKCPHETIKGFEVMRALHKGQAAILNLTGGASGLSASA